MHIAPPATTRVHDQRGVSKRCYKVEPNQVLSSVLGVAIERTCLRISRPRDTGAPKHVISVHLHAMTLGAYYRHEHPADGNKKKSNTKTCKIPLRSANEKAVSGEGRLCNLARELKRVTQLNISLICFSTQAGCPQKAVSTGSTEAAVVSI